MSDVEAAVVSQNTTSGSEAAAAASAAMGADERLAYRGIFQRILTRPEIGAALGALAIWVFFWAVAVPFGRAGGAAGLLDVTAAPLGIMAVAVAMLMIGGEFDLSSGAATGALGIVTILLVRDVTGMMPGGGLNLWLAIIVSLFAALGLGWFNGTVVNRTGLPSFIVTLGAFFVLRGAKLGFAKLLIGQQQVGKLDDLEAIPIYLNGDELNVVDVGDLEEAGQTLDDLQSTLPSGVEIFNVPPPTVDLIEDNIANGLAPLTGVDDNLINVGDRGYGFLNDVFASEWTRNDHVWNSRDWVYTIGIVGGLALIALAIYEMHFRRRDQLNPAGVPVFAAGVVAALIGIWRLHATDGIGANTVAALIIAVGMAVGFVGWSMWRYQSRGAGVDDALGAMADATDDLSEGGLGRVLQPLIAGLAGVGIAVLLASWLSPDIDFDIWPTTPEKLAGIDEAIAESEANGGSLSAKTLSGNQVMLSGIVIGLIAAVMSQARQLRYMSLPALLKNRGVSAIVAFVVAFLAWGLFMFLVTEQGLRAVGFLVFSALGAAGMLTAVNRARSHSQPLGSALLLLTSGLLVAVAFFVRSESLSPKFRTQAFSVMLAIAALMAIWSVVTLMFEARQAPDASADRFGNRLMLVGALAVVIGIVARLMFVTDAELESGLSQVKFSIRIIWFLFFTAACSWVLARTKFGSWTFAVGGNKQAARQVGVPAARKKTQLFMLVSFAAWLVGLLLAFRLNNIQANTGDGEEFEYIIAAVVGGTLLTGGYGSTIGAAIGAFIMAMSVQGIPSSRWNSDWRFVFLGAILLLAVIANNFIRTKAEAAR